MTSWFKPAAPLCNAGPGAYVAPMHFLPRPVSPRRAFADLRDMFSPDRPHRWTILAASVLLTALMVWGLALDSRIPPKPREIFYVESWMEDRKDSDIIKRQLADIAEYDNLLNEKQREFQGVADKLGIEWRKDEMKNRAQRKITMAAVEKQLNKKLADALAREAARGKTGAGAAAPATPGTTPRTTSGTTPGATVAR